MEGKCCRVLGIWLLLGGGDMSFASVLIWDLPSDVHLFATTYDSANEVFQSTVIEPYIDTVFCF